MSLRSMLVVADEPEDDAIRSLSWLCLGIFITVHLRIHRVRLFSFSGQLPY